ncbi:hypothetical protein [Pectobacterium versatile]|uniref:hypothetical protein n=1 Tax=Pectobacterium versatile TaxID=2488639 RepID=UPI001F28E049|nr:hypothetical protein [Pectobacterium versatile]
MSFIPRYVGKRPVTDLPGAALPEKTVHQGQTPSAHETRFAQENLFTAKTVA